MDIYNMPARLDIAARAYIGTPFLHQGRNPSVGLDCVGLLVQSATDCGLHGLLAHDRKDYERNPSARELESRLSRALKEFSDVLPGDVVSMDFYGKTRHVGIIGWIDNGFTLIHAYGRPPKVIEHRLDGKWRRRITGIYRVEANA